MNPERLINFLKISKKAAVGLGSGVMILATPLSADSATLNGGGTEPCIPPTPVERFRIYIEPSSYTTVNGQQQYEVTPQLVRFLWDPVPHADKYWFILYKTQDTTGLARPDFIAQVLPRTSTDITVENSFNYGFATWLGVVAAQNRCGTSEPSFAGFGIGVNDNEINPGVTPAS